MTARKETAAPLSAHPETPPSDLQTVEMMVAELAAAELAAESQVNSNPGSGRCGGAFLDPTSLGESSAAASASASACQIRDERASGHWPVYYEAPGSGPTVMQPAAAPGQPRFVEENQVAARGVYAMSDPGAVAMLNEHCLSGAGPVPRRGVGCGQYGDCCPDEVDWDASVMIPWEVFAQGEYVGPARLAHVPQYRLRVDDTLRFVFRLIGAPSARAYRFNVGDQVLVESLTDPNVNREVQVQPDGSITLRQLGQVPAAGRSIEELRADLEERYKRFIQEPTITVTPTRMNTTLEELRATIDARAGTGGQSIFARVTPEGTVQLPAIGSVSVQGLTLDELKREVEARYAEIVDGIEITPILDGRAPRFIYVVGEVGVPGRIELTGPTTVMQAIAMAGSWNIGADLDHVVVLRRDENWQLMATRLQLHDAFFGRRPCPASEIWLRDSDIVILPKRHIQWTGDLIQMFFTRTVYGVVPVSGAISVNFSKLSTI